MLPIQERMEKQPLLSLDSFLIGSSQIRRSPEGRTEFGVSGEGVVAGTEGTMHGLVERTP